MTRPTLSVCLTTRNAADRLAWWFERVRRYADEIVVAVDAGSTDETFAIACRHADVVTAVELAGFVEPSRDWLTTRAGGDWVLILDDDEALPYDAGEVLDALLADRRYTSYGLPVRWVVADGAGHLAWLRCHPWHSTHWLRLWRNIPGLFYVPDTLHADPIVQGHQGALPADGGVALYHLNLLWSPRAERQAKVERYHRVAAAGGTTADEYYLYEDYHASLVLAPLPSGETFPTAFRTPPPEPKRLEPASVVSYQQLQEHLRARRAEARAVT
jgi:glycosyltransferase involved in cell wall biosynthesis